MQDKLLALCTTPAQITSKIPFSLRTQLREQWQSLPEAFQVGLNEASQLSRAQMRHGAKMLPGNFIRVRVNSACNEVDIYDTFGNIGYILAAHVKDLGANPDAGKTGWLYGSIAFDCNLAGASPIEHKALLATKSAMLCAETIPLAGGAELVHLACTILGKPPRGQLGSLGDPNFHSSGRLADGETRVPWNARLIRYTWITVMEASDGKSFALAGRAKILVDTAPQRQRTTLVPGNNRIVISNYTKTPQQKSVTVNEIQFNFQEWFRSAGALSPDPGIRKSRQHKSNPNSATSVPPERPPLFNRNPRGFRDTVARAAACSSCDPLNNPNFGIKPKCYGRHKANSGGLWWSLNVYGAGAMGSLLASDANQHRNFAYESRRRLTIRLTARLELLYHAMSGAEYFATVEICADQNI
ncbi:hypothetical protein K438DRAFT_1770843 [Mycena galopus ATCC 62051]|nr:hypothetical protein K438DRAFT_1770843 [Mycena galopus ATCC 62051]